MKVDTGLALHGMVRMRRVERCGAAQRLKRVGPDRVRTIILCVSLETAAEGIG